MTSLSSEEVLRAVNPVLWVWVAYFRYGVSKKTFSYLGWYAWRRMTLWIRCKHPRMTWKQMRRRYFPADSIAGDGILPSNTAKTGAERFHFRGAQISTPCSIDEVDPRGARFRRTTRDDVALRRPGPVRRAGMGKATPEEVNGVPSPTQLLKDGNASAAVSWRLFLPGSWDPLRAVP